jgi:uroporphyrin-III C-methyltransferase/precorrin-2 dehydrogenase/sirohydrochlorin ferrochelatase
MEPLARLPLFFALAGKRAVVAGSSAAAIWKAELLSAAGASVHVFGWDPSWDRRASSVRRSAGPIVFHAEEWSEHDFDGAVVAVGAFEDDVAATRFAAASRAAGVPVNVVDKPGLCDFYFGAIVNRSPLVIGISTDGAAPTFAQLVRGQIEALIPHGLARWAEAARAWRSQVRAHLSSSRDRRKFWRKFSERAVRQAESTPGPRDLRELLDEAMRDSCPTSRSFLLVNAGPGDPALLTIGALRALQTADVILFDEDVSADVLDLARREAKKVKVKNIKPERAALHKFVTDLASSAEQIVWLTSVDPIKLPTLTGF